MNAVPPECVAAHIPADDQAAGFLLGLGEPFEIASHFDAVKGKEVVPPLTLQTEGTANRAYRPISIKARLVAGFLAFAASAAVLVGELCLFETVSSNAASALAAAKAAPVASTVAARELRRAKGG